MVGDFGGKVGAGKRATIIKYNKDGTVDVREDSVALNVKTIKVQLPAAFFGPNGEFIGGYPAPQTSCIIAQEQGAQYIRHFLPTDSAFASSSSYMDELKPGRLLFQTAKASSRIIMDATDGIDVGSSLNSLKVDATPEYNKISSSVINHNLDRELAFTLSHRSIKGTITRDVNHNTQRNIEYSSLTDNKYESNLREVGMNPIHGIAVNTLSDSIRNLPLIENRELIYEFADIQNNKFTTDKLELEQYIKSGTGPTITESNPLNAKKTDSRAYAFGLSLDYPNHLMEEIKGTGVDAFGNILDINRNILPIGLNSSSFSENANLGDAFKAVRNLHRKSLAYHCEINARKADDNNDIFSGPSVNDKTDYARERSRFFIDIDKEGQIKMNVPASSETGNIPLLTRYENASNIAFADGKIKDPNLFVFEKDNKDIYHDSFAMDSVSIKDSDNEDETLTPTDRFSNNPIKLGTPFHDIYNSAALFKPIMVEGRDLIPYMPNFGVNQRKSSVQIDQVVSDTIYASGEKANAGGRSGNINMDGFLSVSLGANTVDRQSLWLDTAGGIISTIGKDLNGISYCSTLDGDMLLQVGGYASPVDSRFAGETSSAAKSGVFDLRVVHALTGMITIIRIDEQGVSIATPGRCEIAAESDLILRSNTNILLEAPNVLFFPDNPGMTRSVLRNGNVEI